MDSALGTTDSLARLLDPGPTRVMGIVNVTPDSFADSCHRGIAQAIDLGIELAEQGAALIDVGGESTRPGAERVAPGEEMARVLPVVEALASVGIAVRIDTVHAATAAAALRAGALVINDVSGGLHDPAILAVTAEAGAAYILQHWHIPFDHADHHGDVVAQVRSELAQRASLALAAGIRPDRLILDPGLGFGKTAHHNWQLIAAAPDLAAPGQRVLWGTSRKRFLAAVYPTPTAPVDRDQAAIALTTLLAAQRVWAVRTHSVTDHLTAIAVAEAVRTAEP